MELLTQATLTKTIHFSGIGIHSGNTVSITIDPAPQNHGIQFLRSDMAKSKVVVTPNSLAPSQRMTVLQENQVKIITPEHLLAALYMSGIDNAIITIDNEEVPILDGSALDFTKAIQSVGINHFSKQKHPVVIKKPIKIQTDQAIIIALPHPNFCITYYLDYQDQVVQSQYLSQTITRDSFQTQIAPARTYGFEHEIQALYDSGLAKGGSLENALVIGDKDYLTPLRFDDECVRHKILDIIGDLAILNRPIQGHIVGIHSGHALNQDLVRAIYNTL